MKKRKDITVLWYCIQCMRLQWMNEPPLHLVLPALVPRNSTPTPHTAGNQTGIMSAEGDFIGFHRRG